MKQFGFFIYGGAFRWDIDGDTDSKALALTFINEPDAMSMSFQKEYAEPLDWIAKALKDLTFPFITSKYFYEEADAFNADEKRLMAQGVAAFGGIAPTYRIALLDKPTGVSVLPLAAAEANIINNVKRGFAPKCAKPLYFNKV